MGHDNVTTGHPLHLLLITYPSQGHLTPAVDFARALADSHGVAITVVLTTPSNANKLQIPSTDRCGGGGKISTLILPFPSLTSGLGGVQNGNYSIFETSFRQIMHAMADLHGPILEWARAQPHPPDAIVSDMFLGWTNRLAADLGIPRLVFCTSGALPMMVINYLWTEMPIRRGDDRDGDLSGITFSTLPGSPTVPWRKVSPMYRSYRKGDPLSEFIREGFVENTRSWGYVINTFEDLEGKYLEGLKRDLGHSRVWAVGPVGQLATRNGAAAEDELVGWLDSCPDNSVVYISFGSQNVLRPPQMKAVAAALDRSGVRFVWCTRSTGKAGDEAGEVPKGFEEITAGRGVVVRGWAPQVAVLNHPAVGSFLSHCGWNSVLEAVAAGVVVLTWPLGHDQFSNASLVVDDLRVGARACEGEAVPDPDELAAAFTGSLGPEREAERVRMTALQQRSVEAIGKEDGTSQRDIHAMVKSLRQDRRP